MKIRDSPRRRDLAQKFETLLQKVHKSETQGNAQKRDFDETHHKCRSEIFRLNEKFPRPAVFEVPLASKQIQVCVLRINLGYGKF